MNPLSRHPNVQIKRLVPAVLAPSLIFLATMTGTVVAQDAAVGTTWLHTGIGAPGSVQMEAEGTFVVSDTGVDLWGTNDALHFVYQPLNGDGQITARVLRMVTTNDWAKAGVMIRETLAPDSRNVTKFLSKNNGAGFQWRSKTGGETMLGFGQTNAVAPTWMRLVRKGDWIGGYRSSNGADWTLVDWVRLENLPSQVFVGLEMCSHDERGGVGTAWFDQVSIVAVEPLREMSPVVGTGDGLAAAYFLNRHLWGPPSGHWVDEQVDLGPESLFEKGRREEEFGLRWTGELQAQFNEPYTFNIYRDDGVRLWLNEQLIIDTWKAQPPGETASVPIQLVAGQRYLLRLEYFQNHGGAQVSLRWSSPSTPLHVVPKAQLYSIPTDTDGNGLADLWELHYFGVTGVDANADPDGDGLPTMAEYREWNHPTDPLKRGVPNEWTHGDIEDLSGSEGASTFQDGVFRLTTTYTNGFEHTHYLYRPLGTNAEMVVRMRGLRGNGIDQAGIMVRESLDSRARQALMMTRTNSLRFPVRETRGGSVYQNEQYRIPPATNWLKVVRNNDWVGAYVSADGTAWTLFNWENFSGLAPQAFIGMAIVSENPQWKPLIQTEVLFDQVTFGSPKDEDLLRPMIGTGDGLNASFRNDSLVYLPGITNRVDPVENFYYVHGAAFSVLNPDSYSVRWTGEVQAQFSEAYEFSLQCRRENWVRVWLNEELIIDGWRKWHQDFKDYSKPIQLVAGQRYLLRVEMYNDHGQAISILRWRSPSTPEHQVPQSQLYSQPEMDPSGNGLPVIWEGLYFGKTGVNAGADPDGDGLSNLQEYQYHTNPLRADTERDGIPDAWEIAHGLDPQFNDAVLAPVNSEWNNLQLYQYGLDPANPDANTNGLPDTFEVMYLGGSTTNSKPGVARLALSVNGALATNFLGRWQTDDGGVYCLDRRGAVEFKLSLENADRYVLNLTGTQNQPNLFENKLKLSLSIDGQDLGQFALNATYGSDGLVALVLPYLKAGTHTFRVFWDGAAQNSSLRIRRVTLLAVDGDDADSNGIKDWADAMIADQSGVDGTNAVIESFTSPLCLEGRDAFPAFMSLSMAGTSNLLPTATTDGRWYVDVPLQATNVAVQASYQNGGLIQNRRLRWLRVNLLETNDTLTIRKGDSLWLTALPQRAARGSLQISYGTEVLNGDPAKGIPCTFTNTGRFTVTGSFVGGDGVALQGSLNVVVVGQSLPEGKIAAWTGMERDLVLPYVAPEIVLQADSRLSCYVRSTNSTGGVRLALGVDSNAERSLVARLGADGPVLDSTRVSGFDEWCAYQTYTRKLKAYEDGSQLIETLLISSPVQPDVMFVFEPIVSGVVFEDGTITKTITARDFDALGQVQVRFIRPASATTSVCHAIRAYQGSYMISYQH